LREKDRQVPSVADIDQQQKDQRAGKQRRADGRAFKNEHGSDQGDNIADEGAGTIAEPVIEILCVAAHHAAQHGSRIDQRADGAQPDDDSKRGVGVAWYERYETREQDEGVVKHHRRRESACGTAPFGADIAGADRGGDEQQRHQRRRCCAEQSANSCEPSSI